MNVAFFIGEQKKDLFYIYFYSKTCRRLDKFLDKNEKKYF